MACNTVVTVVLGLFILISGATGAAAGPAADTADILQDKNTAQPLSSINSSTVVIGLNASAYASPVAAHDDRFTLPQKPTDSAFASATTEGQAAVPEGDQLKDFVKASGTSFTVNGAVRTFRGSNDFFLILRNFLTDDQVRLFFKLMSSNGINLIRTWAFVNGKDDPVNGPYAMQPTVGVFNEDGFKRLDLILSEAAIRNTYVILPFVNYWPDLGGIQWYVDQVLGKGKPQEEFYINSAIKDAFKSYIKKILTRTNTINGRKYIEDPTILSLELANEPHTSDNWEKNHGKQPGSIVRAWIAEMAAYIRFLDPNHMISTGEEGYRCGGSGWTEDCSKGVDFDANLRDPNIAFATIHVYPSKWQIPPSGVQDFVNSFVLHRATIAHAAGKPIMLEESGIDVKEYSMSRDKYYDIMRSAAQRAGLVAMLPWQLVPWQLKANEGSGYDFDFKDPSSKVVTTTLSYVVAENATVGGVPSPKGGPPSQPQEAAVRACRAEILVGPEWNAGDSKTGAKLQISLSSQSKDTITAPYKVTLAGPVAYLSAQSSWGWNGAADMDGQVVGTVEDSYLSLKPNGGNVASIGTIVLYKDPGSVMPSTLTINGVKCSLIASASTGQ